MNTKTHIDTIRGILDRPHACTEHAFGYALISGQADAMQSIQHAWAEAQDVIDLLIVSNTPEVVGPGGLVEVAATHGMSSEITERFIEQNAGIVPGFARLYQLNKVRYMVEYFGRDFGDLIIEELLAGPEVPAALYRDDLVGAGMKVFN